jgi:hypothetical protein
VIYSLSQIADPRLEPDAETKHHVRLVFTARGSIFGRANKPARQAILSRPILPGDGFREVDSSVTSDEYLIDRAAFATQSATMRNQTCRGDRHPELTQGALRNRTLTLAKGVSRKTLDRGHH